MKAKIILIVTLLITIVFGLVFFFKNSTLYNYSKELEYKIENLEKFSSFIGCCSDTLKFVNGFIISSQNDSSVVMVNKTKFINTGFSFSINNNILTSIRITKAK